MFLSVISGQIYVVLSRRLRLLSSSSNKGRNSHLQMHIWVLEGSSGILQRERSYWLDLPLDDNIGRKKLQVGSTKVNSIGFGFESTYIGSSGLTLVSLKGVFDLNHVNGRNR